MKHQRRPRYLVGEGRSHWFTFRSRPVPRVPGPATGRQQGFRTVCPDVEVVVNAACPTGERTALARNPSRAGLCPL